MGTVATVGRNTQELGSWASQNRHLAFLGPKLTKFLSELWSLATEALS